MNINLSICFYSLFQKEKSQHDSNIKKRNYLNMRYQAEGMSMNIWVYKLNKS